jgi:L-fuconolactonase
VRRLLQGEPDAGFCTRPQFVAGVRELARRGLVFDLCVYHFQLPAVIELVRAVPEARFVLDHIGKPPIARAVLEPWATYIRVLAGCANVVCKLSGVATEADHRRWAVADLQPYIGTVVECFGYTRLMFGSDWPVSLQAVSYARWVEIVEQAIAGGGPSARAQVFHDTAAATYGLDA